MKAAEESADCDVHVLVCTNTRADGRTGCADFGGQEFYKRLKDELKKTGKSRNTWVTRTGCLGFCNPIGTTVAIHRRSGSWEWFTEVTAEDFDSVWQHIVRE